MNRLQVRARALIVGGWAFVLFGSIAYTLLLVHLGYFSSGQSLAAQGTVVLPVIGNGAAVAAWLWLTRLKVSPDQTSLIQKAFYALSLQALFVAGSVLASVSAAQTVTTTEQLVVVALVFEAVGSLAVFAGFVVMAGALTPRRPLPREVPRAPDLAPFADEGDEVDG